MIEYRRMIQSNRFLPWLLLASILLAACSHSRVVRRDGSDGDRVARGSQGQASRNSRAEPSAIPAGATYVVRAGETLYGISFRFGLRYQDVAAWNGIADPYRIEIGQRLRLRPPTSGNSVATTPRNGTSAPARRPSAPGAAVAGTAAAGGPSAGNAVANGATSQRAPLATPVPALPIGPMPDWRWPTQGQIVGRYVGGDQTQQGINIAGSAGQDVKAAADGVVVYSGAGLVGYGELIIIKHSDEWLSAYAHNRRRLVSEGARVKSGQAIAEMGRTGASRDMLHFEIRRNGKPLDPLSLLPRP